MLNWEIAKRLTSSNQDKKDCLQLLDTILKLSVQARKHGLLSLEPEINKSHNLLIRKALQFVVDGIEPSYIRNILQGYIYSGNYHGKELLERILVVEGVLSIQAGENPILIREKLSSYFGEDFSSEIDKFFGNETDSSNEKIQSYINSVSNLVPNSPTTSLLEAPFQKLDDRSLQRLLRDVVIEDLVLAISGASGKVQKKVMNNTSKKIALILIEELNSLVPPVPHKIVESQNKIIEIMMELRTNGEII